MVTGTDKKDSSVCRSILVFDGEPVVLELLASVLRREGYSVIATLRGDEALDLMSSRCFDLAITDLGLRQADGCYLVRKIRQMRPETPIVAMTAYPANEVVSFAEEHAEAFLAKPFGISELLAVVRRALERQFVRGSGQATTTVSGEGVPAPAATG